MTNQNPIQSDLISFGVQFLGPVASNSIAPLHYWQRNLWGILEAAATSGVLPEGEAETVFNPAQVLSDYHLYCYRLNYSPVLAFCTNYGLDLALLNNIMSHTHSHLIQRYRYFEPPRAGLGEYMPEIDKWIPGRCPVPQEFSENRLFFDFSLDHWLCLSNQDPNLKSN